MQRSGVADLPLHGGRVPQWLAERMSRGFDIGLSGFRQAGFVLSKELHVKETSMIRVLEAVAAFALVITIALAQTLDRATLAASKPAAAARAKANTPLVEFEMMTWPEVKQALEEGKTTALF